MNIRNVVAIASLAACAAVPFAAHAGASQRASDACVQAFVDKYLPADSRVRVRKSGQPAGPLQIYARQFTLDLSAYTETRGNGLVSVRCVANANGEVLSLDLLAGL